MAMSPSGGSYLPNLPERGPNVAAERLRESVADWSAALAAVSDMPSSVRQDVVDALELARRFNAEVVRPQALAWDKLAQEDPASVPRDLVRQAGEWGLFTLWIPTLFGGRGWNFVSLYAFLEEVASACVGVSNLIGVHYMGVATLTASWNLRLAARVFGEVCAGERRGEPCLLSLALNEAEAGSDTVDTHLLARARLGTQAQVQPDGGYLLNGRKTCISNAPVSTWHMVVAYEDLARPDDTMVVLAVRAQSKGVRVGEAFDKVGQKACVASELWFEQCAVPADGVAIDRRLAKGLQRPYREVSQTLLDYISSCTRAGVGAFAAGTARGALEAARDQAARTVLPAGRMIDQQWAQTTLAEMSKNATLARQAYLESALANGLGGLFRMMFFRPMYWADQLAPAGLWRFAARWVLRSPQATDWFQRRFLDAQPKEWQRLTSGLASMAKFAGSDLAMANVNLALDLHGADGLRHEAGAEKRWRDAKLLQLYEGTDQINRVNLFKCRVQSDPKVRVFEREAEAWALPAPRMVWPATAPQGPAEGWAAVAEHVVQHALGRLGARALLDHMHGLGWAHLCSGQAGASSAQTLTAWCQVLEALAGADMGVAAMVFSSGAAGLALAACGAPGQVDDARWQDLRGDWLAWPAFHDLQEQLWPTVDAQGYLRGQADMLLLGAHAHWAVLPVLDRERGTQLAVVDLRHPAVIRGAPLHTLGLAASGLSDVEFGGVPCELLGPWGEAAHSHLSGALAAGVMAMQCGTSRASLHEAVARARTRQQGGGSLLGWGEVRRLLSGMHGRLSVMQGLLSRAVLADWAPSDAHYAALHVGELANALCTDAVQIMGAEGYRDDGDAARRMKDARQAQGLMGGVACRRQSLLVRA